NFFAGVAEVEVKLAVRAEDERMHGMIVLDAFDAGEKNLLLVGFAVAIFVGENENIGRAGDDDLFAKDANAERAVDVETLIKGGGFVGFAIPVAVFENDNAVAFGPQGRLAPLAIIGPRSEERR